MSVSRWGRIGADVGIFAAGVLLAALPERAPIAVFLALATTSWPLARAVRAARGTALRAAVLWACVAVGLGLVAQACAWSEPLASGRPGAGHWAYLSALATLAALLSVLNARTPGGGAWAVLMVLLIVVFLIPWLEGPGLARWGQGMARLRLDSPWTLFYALLVVAGVTNYLPTRYGPAAAWLALGFGAEYVGLTRTDPAPSVKAMTWAIFPWTLAAALWSADRRSRRGAKGDDGLERTWFWFRDHWGVVWALRVQERFNRSAERLGWPVRLAWQGVAPPSAPVPDAAEATLKGLLRRFADPARIDEVAEAGWHPPRAEGVVNY